MRVFVFLLAALPFTALAQVDFAQMDQIGDNTSMEATANLDQRVLSKMHAVNQMEVSLARLALERTKNTDVREFAQMMVMDHSKADRMLVDFCSRSRIVLTPFMPMTPPEIADDQKDKETMTQLQTLQGRDFDRLYITANTDDHLKVYNWLRDHERGLTVGPLNQVQTQLPVIWHHYSMADRLKSRI